MQIIENRTQVRGVVQHVSAQSDVAQFGTLHLLVQQLAAVANVADLLSSREPISLAVLVPLAELTNADLTEGQTVEVEVRLATPDRLFAYAGTLHRLR
ncbi:hypothetical protein FAES_4243 [Fibrella aestuarina BUZ 2]|uniref:Uncharacterized protein n=1 Tax=Fibrella aestuarina BUZ 2 TaxID=1166018 RepID=I0KDP0_9BACT|nr:hypothetical protein [Fibrella aestuarina]CCH02243.1 hypothetical protein FAES_4243 [Fibrella aestuarina BUZ 2]